MTFTKLFDDECDAAWFRIGHSHLKPAAELTEEQNRTLEELRRLAAEFKIEVWPSIRPAREH